MTIKWLKQSKDAILVFLGLIAFHVVEDSIWLVLGRYTDIPLWVLLLGVALITILMTKFVRRFHGH